MLDIILMTVKPGYNATQVEKKIRTLMAREHHFNPEDKAALFCVNSADMFKLIDNVFTYPAYSLRSCCTAELTMSLPEWTLWCG